MARRCRIAIPLETWAYLLILTVVIVGAFMREINLLIILGGLMIGPLLISWQMVRLTLRNLEVKRRPPSSVFAGETIAVDLTVHNPRKRLDAWSLVLEDRIRPVQPARGPSRVGRLLLPYVPAGEKRVVTYRGAIQSRGRYRLGPLRVSTGMPLGLLQGYVSFRETHEFLVYPKLGELTQKWSELVNVDRFGQRSWRRNQGPIEGDFYGLRDWRAGDSRRWIHWRSSAKRNELVVRQFEQHRTQDFVVVLDLWQPATNSDDTQRHQAIETAISFVATIVADQGHKAAGHLVLGVSGRSPRIVYGPASATLITESLEVLTEAGPSKEDNLPSLLGDVLQRVSGDDRFVMVTTRPQVLNDSQRFGKLTEDPRFRLAISRLIAVDVTSQKFAECFSLPAKASVPSASGASSLPHEGPLPVTIEG